MFYANFVLAKKGPLARVWLAAHWEKKLSKAHVFETDLQSSVDNIISPKVKIALRTSGHLLLGVVRIYSRKAKYLLADCTEALIKIKMAFRPDVVDLPLDNQKAAVSAITLPELQDWDQMVSELGTFDINTFNNNVCRVEDITMKEDLITSRYLSVTDDNFFGDTPFGEIGSDRENLRDDDMAEGREILRDGNAGGGSFVREENSVLGDINDENNSTKGDTTLINQSNLDLGMTDPMMGDGGFKAGEGLDFLEGFGIEGINDVPGITDIDGADPKLDQLDDTLVNKGDDSTALPELDAPKTPGGASEPMEPIDGIEDISAIPGPNQLPTYNENEEEEEMDSQPLDDEEVDEIGADLGETAAAIKAKIQSDNDAVFGIDQTEPEQDPFQEALKEPEVQEPEDPQETDFMTTLFSRDEEALNLEPIEVVDKKNKPKKRKRKLVVDQEKILVTEQIKAQIKCDEDIIKTAVVAPPTKARFVLLESSSCACFSQPPASIQTKRRRLNDIYNINMTLEKPDDLVLPSSQDEHEEVHLEKVPEVVQAEQVVEDPIEQIDHIEKINGVQEVLELPAALEAPIPEEVVEEPEKVLGEEEEEPRDEERRTHDIFQELVRNNDEIEKHIEMDEEMKEVEEELRNEEGINIAPAFELIREEKETDIELEDDGFQVMYEECEEEEDDEEEDPHFVDNNKRWTNRTHQTLKAVQKGLKRRQPIYFTDLTKKSTRKQAAYTFYTLLILSKEQAIDVQQSDLFGSISIDRGAKFQAHV